MMWLQLRIVLPTTVLTSCNISKCKYMVISRKRTPTTPASPILLNGIPLGRVGVFKHLGVVVSSDLSCICAKAKGSWAYSIESTITMLKATS